jgi:predicted secreted protein
MAIQALTAEVVTINSVDVSAYCKNATLALDVNQLDTTDFASGGWTEMIGGLKSGTLSLEIMDDVADDQIDEDFYALLGTVVAFTVKLNNAGISVNNPEYQGSVLINSHSIGGAVGDLATKSYSFPITGAITRDITP